MSGSLFFHADITTFKGRIFDATGTETLLHAQLRLGVSPGLFNSWTRLSFVHELYADKFAIHGVSLGWINTGTGEKKVIPGMQPALIEPCPIGPAFSEALSGCRRYCPRVCKFSAAYADFRFLLCARCDMMEAWATTCRQCKRACKNAGRNIE